MWLIGGSATILDYCGIKCDHFAYQICEIMYGVGMFGFVNCHHS
jgi:hypothetical protein